MWKDLTMSQRAEVIQMAIKNGMRDLNQIRSFYDESIGSRRFGEEGHIYDGTSEPTGQMQKKKVAYISPYYPGKKFATQREVRQANWDYKHPNEKRKRDMAAMKEAMKEAMRRRQSDYLTTSNDNTWVESKDPMVRATSVKNPHLAKRGVEGAKAHAAWVEEHPILDAWGMALGAAPLAVAAAPAIAAGGEGLIALGDAAAATTAGQALTSALAPVTTAGATNIAGAPATAWVNAGLNSLSVADGLNNIIEERGISPMSALEITPIFQLSNPLNQAVHKPWNKGVKRLNKIKKRLTEDVPDRFPFESDYRSSMDKVYDPILHEKADYMIPASEREKNAFRTHYSRVLNSSASGELKGVDYTSFGYNPQDTKRLASLFGHNPEYYIHVTQNGIKDPLSQEAVNSFIDRQLTSIRGVSAPDIETAKTYLTTTQRGRYMPGGDRLNTQGGLYVSNNPIIGDTFKNPVGRSTSNGYIGVLKEPDTIDRTLSLEDQLKALRNRTELAGYEDPLMSTPYREAMDITPASMYEAPYVGRASKGTGGYERAYLPTGDFGEITSPVELKSITEYVNQVDKNGRWGQHIDPIVSNDLFIAKQLNGYDDYIKRARALLKGHKETNWDVYNAEYPKLFAPSQRRIDLRAGLLKKLDSRKEAFETVKYYSPWIGGMAGSIGGIFGLGAYTAAENEKHKQYFEDGLIERSNSPYRPLTLTEKGKQNMTQDMLDYIKERNTRAKKRYDKRNKHEYGGYFKNSLGFKVK